MQVRLVTAALALLPLVSIALTNPSSGLRQDAPQDAPQDKAVPAGPEVGKPAPSFRLNDQTGAAVTVGGAAKTWTVLAFYPKAATRG